MDIHTSLQTEILRELKKLEEMEVGTDEYKAVVDGVSKLIDRDIEKEKLEDERCNKVAQGKEDRIDRWFKNGIAVFSIAIPTLVTVWGTIKTLKFEETGTVTTAMGRGFINKLLPKK